MRTPGISVVTSDPAGKILGNSSQQQTELYFDIPSQDAVYQVNRIHNGKLTVKFPVSEVHQLGTIYPVEQHLANESRNPCQNENNKNGLSGFDNAVYQLIPWAAEAENIDFDVEESKCRRLKALILAKARQMNLHNELPEYLRNSQIATHLGFRKIPDGSTFHRAESRLVDNPSVIENAAARIAHAAFRNGYDVPHQSIKTKANPAISYDLDYPKRRHALSQWGNIFLSEFIPFRPFDRSSNTRYSASTAIGTLALSAYTRKLNKGPPLARLLGGKIPNTKTIIDMIADLTASEIAEFMYESHVRSIEYASECNFFFRPQKVAVDGTWQPVGKYTTSDGIPNVTIDNRYISDRPSWHFVAATTLNDYSRFSAGISLVEQKNNRADHFSRILSRLAENCSIEWIIADSEFTEGRVARAFDAISDDKLLIRSKEVRGEVKEFVKSVDQGESAVTTKEKLGDYHKPLQMVAYPVAENHHVYLTNMAASENSPSEIKAIYDRRWGIETFFRKIKHDLLVPTKSKKPNVHLFLWNLASLFYNCYKLADQTVTPKIGVPLDLSAHEILLGIALAGLNSSEAPLR